MSHGEVWAQKTFVLALALVHSWIWMRERCEVTSINELAEHMGVDPIRIGRTLRLASLALDITQAILTYQEPYGSRSVGCQWGADTLGAQ